MMSIKEYALDVDRTVNEVLQQKKITCLLKMK